MKIQKQTENANVEALELLGDHPVRGGLLVKVERNRLHLDLVLAGLACTRSAR